MAHYACLSFDLDAYSRALFQRTTGPVALSQAEFAVVGGARVLDLLRRDDVRTTWFVPGHTIDAFPALAERVHAEGHEVAHHGYLHEVPARLTADEERRALERGSDRIRRLTSRPPRGYRAPGWDMSARTIDLLLEHGFEYDSSLMASDLPYLVRRGDVIADGNVAFGETSTLIELPVHWSRDDLPHFEYQRRETGIQSGLMRADDVLANWVDDFRYLCRMTSDGVLTYTMHPEVIGRGHRMLMLERLIGELRALGAVFVRMDEAQQLARAWLG